MRIQDMDMVQPPGMVMPPIDAMDAHQRIVTVALPAKRRAETPKKAE
jgi:hypothetical protein